MTRLDAGVRLFTELSVHIWGAVSHPVSRCCCCFGHLDQIACTHEVPGRGSSGGSRLGATPVLEATAESRTVILGAGSLGSTLAHVPRGIPHRAVATVPTPLSGAHRVRTAWEEWVLRNFQQGARSGGKLRHSVGVTPAPGLTAPPLSKPPDFPGR